MPARVSNGVNEPAGPKIFARGKKIALGKCIICYN